MTPKKKYVAKRYDGDYDSWRVYDGERMVEEFVGFRAMQYAREHAKRLNALPEKEKPC